VDQGIQQKVPVNLRFRLRADLWRLRGRRPWTSGYQEAKEIEIGAAIDRTKASGRFEIVPGYGVGLDERAVEYPWFFQHLPSTAQRVLDAGSTLNHRMVMMRFPLQQIRLFVTTLAPEQQAFTHLGVSYTFEDFRDLCFREAYFDCVVALSSLEHVGMDNTMLYTDKQQFKQQSPEDYLQAVTQIKRVLKPGGLLLASVPYGIAESFGWFQQFDRAMVSAFIKTFEPSHKTVDFYKYHGDGWKVSDQESCDDARYYDVHGGANSQADRAAASRAVACLHLVK
jgi:SAM-dependent methyltransferase